eukprot:SM000067S20315  [mRNA]  locus=s67:363479:367079:+ [translate_table: standard]
MQRLVVLCNGVDSGTTRTCRTHLRAPFAAVLAETVHLNLNHYKPEALKKLLIHRLHLARTLRATKDGSDAALELDFSFIADRNMGVELLARLKARRPLSLALGNASGVSDTAPVMTAVRGGRQLASFGLGGKLYGNNLRIEGKLRAGVSFLPYYPYVSRLRLSFVAPPLLQLSIRPLASNGFDVFDLPGIATWVTKAIKAAVVTTLVEPNALTMDLVKMFGTNYGIDDEKVALFFMRNGQIKLRKKPEVAFVIVEILDAKDLIAMDRNGSSDPYVKLRLDKNRCATSVRWHTLEPSWHETFRLRVGTWRCANRLVMKVRDRDTFGKDDSLGDCSVDLVKLRGGARHELWLNLEGVKSGQLHVAITVGEQRTVQRTVSGTADAAAATTSSAAGSEEDDAAAAATFSTQDESASNAAFSDCSGLLSSPDREARPGPERPRRSASATPHLSPLQPPMPRATPSSVVASPSSATPSSGPTSPQLAPRPSLLLSCSSFADGHEAGAVPGKDSAARQRHFGWFGSSKRRSSKRPVLGDGHSFSPPVGLQRQRWDGGLPEAEPSGDGGIEHLLLDGDSGELHGSLLPPLSEERPAVLRGGASFESPSASSASQTPAMMAASSSAAAEALLLSACLDSRAQHAAESLGTASQPAATPGHRKPG